MMELKAVPSPKPDNDSLDDAFFSQSSISPVEIDGDELGGWDEAPALTRGTRRAMLMTLGMLGVSIAGLGLFLFYSHVLMPTPVELGAASATLPTLPPLPPSAATLSEPFVAHAQTIAPTVAAIEPAAAPAPAFELRDTRAPTAREVRKAPSHASGEGSGDSRDSLVKQAFRSLNSGDARGAITLARRIVNATPDRADAWLVLGTAYDTLHDRGSALLAFRACAMHGQGPTAATCAQLARQ